MWTCFSKVARVIRHLNCSCTVLGSGVGGGCRPQLLVECRLARDLASQASGLRGRSRGLARVAHSSDVGGADRARSSHTVKEGGRTSHGGGWAVIVVVQQGVRPIAASASVPQTELCVELRMRSSSSVFYRRTSDTRRSLYYEEQRNSTILHFLLRQPTHPLLLWVPLEMIYLYTLSYKQR